MTTSVLPSARFDNVREHTTTILSGFVRELRADELGDVLAVVAQAEESARQGLWVSGFVAYEAAPAFDPGLRVKVRAHPTGAGLPLAWFGLFREAKSGPLSLPRYQRTPAQRSWRWSIDEEGYVKRVRSILDEIDVGTTYQVNLTNQLSHRGPIDALGLYRQLLLAQQPQYGALIDIGGTSIVSASPELFIEWDGSNLVSRPMKGTARRGRFEEEDQARAGELLSSPKERAENIMIVDLIRNDMGKVAAVGSVEVTALCSLEPYPNVWQLVSEVRCTTKPGTRLIDIFRAMFPCGSVTGAPKQSAMEIINRLEVGERGVYCGAVGIVQPHRGAVRARFSVAIRTATIDHERELSHYGSGGGVVAESSPEREYEEIALKAEMLSAPAYRPFRLLETFGYGGDRSSDRTRRHLARMRASALMLGFRYPEDLEERVVAALGDVTEPTRVRLLLSRNGRYELQRATMPEPRSVPVRLALDDEPVSSDSPLLFHKTTMRDLYDRRRRKFPWADDVVLVNERGECTEVTIANLAVRCGSTWLTPPLSSGCLPGVERAKLLEDGALEEAVLRPEVLESADELAVFNSLRGWQRATLGRRRGEITRQAP